MAGFNGQEEGFLVRGLPSNIKNGITIEEAAVALTSLVCPDWLQLPESPGTCAELLNNLYRIDSASNDMERLVRLGEALGKFQTAPECGSCLSMLYAEKQRADNSISVCISFFTSLVSEFILCRRELLQRSHYQDDRKSC